MKIGVIMLRYPPGFTSPVMSKTIELLAEWGVEIDILYPEEQVIHVSRVTVEHDLYVLKSRTEMALAYAGLLWGAGAAIVNPYPAAAIMRHRISAVSMMRKGGVPVPESYVTAHPEQLIALLEEGPLAVKLYRGTGIRGLHVLWDAEEMDDVPTNQGPIFAQRFIPRDETIRKLYVISGEVFGVVHPWLVRHGAEEMGTPFTITPRLREIALRCGETFGIETFGLSIVGKEEEPYVVDVHSFPDFKGVPNASLRLADFIYHYCRRVMRGEVLSGALPVRREA